MKTHHLEHQCLEYQHPQQLVKIILIILSFIGLSLVSGQITNQAGEGLPACGYEDRATAFTSYDDWQVTLLDTLYKLPADYAPTDLVPVRQAGFDSDLLMRGFVIEDLRALRDAALAAGHPLAVQSAYRSYSYQDRTFNYWVNLQGRQAALLSSARPGHSEHQLGTAVDFRSANGPPAWDLADWADTPAGAWTVANAWRYGFALSYPKNTQEITCYIYEPWHYRYVGRELAAQLQARGITLREWLWELQPY